MAFVMFRVLFRTGKDVLKGSVRYNSCFCRSLTRHSSILHACTFEYILHLHLHLETGLGLRISPIIIYAFISFQKFFRLHQPLLCSFYKYRLAFVVCCCCFPTIDWCAKNMTQIYSKKLLGKSSETN